MGHPALDRTVEHVRKYFWFPKLKQFVGKYIDACIPDCKSKHGIDELRYELHYFEKEHIPFQTIHVDFSGPYPRGKGGKMNMFLLLLMRSQNLLYYVL